MKNVRKVGSIVLVSIICGLLLALVLVLLIFPGAIEPVITGALMVGFAVGWLMLALLSSRYTDQPQRWAYVPAAFMGVVGLSLLVIRPGRDVISALGWVWPPLVAILVVWIYLQAKKHLHSRARYWVLYPVLVVLALTAIGGVYEKAQEHADSSKLTYRGQSIDVGGYKLHIQCTGSGNPIVVLEPGLGEPFSATNGLITPAVAKHTRVCVYDREGRGWSDESPHPLDGRQTAAALHTLLTKAGVEGPIVMAGHSAGGLYVLNYAYLYPKDVAGVVLLDSMTPYQYEKIGGWSAFYNGYKRASALLPTLSRLGVGHLSYASYAPDFPPVERNEERAFLASPNGNRSQRDEFSVIRTSLDEAKSLKTLGGRPLYVITALQGAQQGWLNEQDHLAKLSTNSVHKVAAKATHESLVNDQSFSGMSSKAIIAVVEAARNNTVLSE